METNALFNLLVSLKTQSKIDRKAWVEVLDQIPHVMVFDFEESDSNIICGCFPQDILELQESEEHGVDLTGLFFFHDHKRASVCFKDSEGMMVTVTGSWHEVLETVVRHVSEKLMFPDILSILDKLRKKFESD